MSSLKAWLMQTVVLRPASRAVELRDGDDVLSSIPFSPGHAADIVDELDSQVLEHGAELRVLGVAIVDRKGDVLASRSVRTKGGREKRSDAGVVAQLMRHNEKLMAEYAKLAAERSRDFETVLGAALSENKRMTARLDSVDEKHMQMIAMVEKLANRQAERELERLAFEREDGRKQKAFVELTEKWGPAVMGFIRQGGNHGKAVRRLLESVAVKAPEELDALVKRLEASPAAKNELKALEELMGVSDSSPPKNGNGGSHVS